MTKIRRLPGFKNLLRRQLKLERKGIFARGLSFIRPQAISLVPGVSTGR